jgi:hypothetical protein
MTSDNAPTPKPFSIPRPQDAMRTVLQKAVEALSGQSDAQLEWLGAERVGHQWRLPVMDGVFLADASTGDVACSDGAKVKPTWQILALHYLAVRAQPAEQPPEVTFASFPAARTYAVVYEQRVNRRLCAGVGKNAERLPSAAAAIGAQPVRGGDLAYDVRMFPRLRLRLIWHSGDDELPPSCTVLLPANSEAFFCTEDIVVLSESFVSRLNGKPF